MLKATHCTPKYRGNLKNRHLARKVHVVQRFSRLFPKAQALLSSRMEFGIIKLPCLPSSSVPQISQGPFFTTLSQQPIFKPRVSKYENQVPQ